MSDNKRHGRPSMSSEDPAEATSKSLAEGVGAQGAKFSKISKTPRGVLPDRASGQGQLKDVTGGLKTFDSCPGIRLVVGY